MPALPSNWREERPIDDVNASWEARIIKRHDRHPDWSWEEIKIGKKNKPANGPIIIVLKNKTYTKEFLENILKLKLFTLHRLAKFCEVSDSYLSEKLDEYSIIWKYKSKDAQCSTKETCTDMLSYIQELKKLSLIRIKMDNYDAIDLELFEEYHRAARDVAEGLQVNMIL